MTANNPNSRSAWAIAAAGMGISLLISLWIWAVNDAINVDAINYIEMADRVRQGGWNFGSGRALWFYSNLVGVFSLVTGMGSENAAYLLNALFTSAAVGIFSYATLKMTQNKAVAISATALLLLNPHFNEYRAYIIRDPGYWMLFAWSFLNLVIYYQTHRRVYAVLWGVSLSLAVLFRIEAIVYLAIVPLLFLFAGKVSPRQRYFHLLWCYSIPAAGVLLFYLLSASGVIGLSFHGAGYFHQGNPLTGLFSELSNRADILNQSVFNGMSDKQSLSALMAALLVILGYKIFSVSSPLTLILAGYSIGSQWGRLYEKHAVLIWYLAISFVILYGFVLHQYFLQGRYVLSLTFCLTILAAPGLAKVMQKNVVKSEKINKVIFIFTLLWLVFMFLDGMWSFGARKHYIKDAGSWTQQNIVREDTLYSNHPVFFYYAGRSRSEQPAVGWLEIEKDLERGHVPDVIGTAKGYMALEIDYKEVTLNQQILDTGKVILLKSFSNKRGDAVNIYQLK